MIAWLVQIQNLIGKAADAASMASTLFAGQQQIHDDITAAIGSAPTEKSLQDILHKDGNFTFDNTTDSLEALRDKINTLPTTLSYTPLAYTGTCDAGMSASATTVVCAGLAGFGDDYLNHKFWMAVMKNVNSVGNAPEMEVRQITDYVSASGTFTVNAFSANVEANDLIMVLHESLPFLKKREITTGAGNWTVPKGCQLVDVVVVGAGGGGGGRGSNNGGGGGGGGEIVWAKNYPVGDKSVIAYTIGPGGGGGAYGTDGSVGGSSAFDGLTALGGNGGYDGNDGTYPMTGGDGGGANGGAGGAGGNPGSSGSDGTEAGVIVVKYGGGGGGGGGSTFGSAAGSGGRGLRAGAAGGAAAAYNGGGGGGSWGTAGAGASTGAATAGVRGGGGGGASSNANSAAGGDGYIMIFWR